MQTKVTQSYTPSLNVSVTERDGVPSRVTLWTSGVEGSTHVVVDTQRSPVVRVNRKPQAGIAGK